MQTRSGPSRWDRNAWRPSPRRDEISRSRLVATFWPDKTEEASRYRLRHSPWALRRALGKKCVQGDDYCWLGLSEIIWIDAQEFRHEWNSMGIGG